MSRAFACRRRFVYKRGLFSPLLYAERKEMQSVIIYFWTCRARTRKRAHARSTMRDVAPCGAFSCLNIANKRVICRCLSK